MFHTSLEDQPNIGVRRTPPTLGGRQRGRPLSQRHPPVAAAVSAAPLPAPACEDTGPHSRDRASESVKGIRLRVAAKKAMKCSPERHLPARLSAHLTDPLTRIPLPGPTYAIRSAALKGRQTIPRGNAPGPGKPKSHLQPEGLPAENPVHRPTFTCGNPRRVTSWCRHENNVEHQ